MENKTALASFVVGKTYSCRSVCDYNCVWSFKVIARTSKTVTIEGNGLMTEKTASRRIQIVDNAEQIFPIGRYSMAPVLKAN
jgi:hypothetical protein